MRSSCAIVVVVVLTGLGLRARDARGGVVTGPDITGDVATVSLSSAPPARVVVSLDGDDGSRIALHFDTAASEPLRRASMACAASV